ncbi:MAG: lipopolysaccharide biosynthesis protein [Bacteroidia bacterium]|nr:lipopolysaccharide biosynthesis protein [Bacteroidia bacterium]
MENTMQDSEEISLKELIQKIVVITGYLKSQWCKLLLLGFLGGLVGFFYAKSQKPVYTAKLTFALAEGGDKVGGLGSIASQFGIDIMGGSSGGAFSGDNLLELMKSRLLVEKTLLTAVDSNGKRKLLINQYIDFNKPKKPNPRKPTDPTPVFYSEDKLNPDQFSLAQDSFLGKVCGDLAKKHLTVSKVDKKLAIVSVSFTGPDEWFAKHFTQVLTQNVTEFYVETKTRQMRKNVMMMEHKVDSVKQALGRAMYGVASEVDGNQFLVRGVAKVPQAKKQLEIQVLSTMYGELLKNLELSRTLMAKEQPLIQLIDKPRFPLEKKRSSKILTAVGGALFLGFLGIITLLLRRWWKTQFD